MPALERQIRPPVVVVANDEEWASRSLESLLGPKGYAVLRVPSGRQALELVRAMQPDALILDARTQDMTAIEICRALRNDPQIRAGMPIIVTANDGGARAERVQAFGAGAWDYCTQPIDGEVLLLKLATFLRAKQEFDRARDDSLIDEQTGLYSLRGLTRRAREIGAHASRGRQPLACVAFVPVREEDVEPSLSVSSPGSAIVGQVAQVCRSHGRTSDVFGRIGAAEFAVVAPATDDRGAAALLVRLQSALSDSTSAEQSRPGVRLLAGVTSVADFSVSNVDVMEMLISATDELRRVRMPAPDPTR